MGKLSNEELVEKAVATTDALAAAGKLNPAQSDRFLDYVFDETGLKNNARTVKFRNEKLEIDKIGVGKRVAMPADEAVSPSVRRGVNTSKITLQPKEIIVPFEIGQSFTEINLEGDQVEDHIIRMMATQLANDFETLYIEGDVLGRADLESNLLDGGSTTQYIKDKYLGLHDGWLRLADSGHIFDANGQNIGSNLFSEALTALPTKFRRNRGNLRYITSQDLEQKVRERFSTRATATGDSALNSAMNLTPFGVPLVPFNLYPFKYREVEHHTLNATTAEQLRRINIANQVVTLSSLASTPTTPFINVTDYTLDAVAGTIAGTGGGAIGDGATVKVTYDAPPTFLLTHYTNLIVGIGRDVTIEKDRDIYRRVNQYAITAKVAIEIEEVDALVKVVNIGTGV